MKNRFRKILLLLLIILSAGNLFYYSHVQAYSLTKDRPVFLAWPLPDYIGVARISQFPNTPWTWNFLGLNAASQCPPAFGYLEVALSVWRDPSISWEQDSAQADPHQFQMIECYATGGEAGTNGHEGTDIKAPFGTPAYASADGKVAGWRLGDLNSMIVLKHCLGGTWDSNNECANGVKWYTTYMHIVIDPAMQVMNLDVKTHTQLGTVYNQGDNSHLHFEVGLDKRNYSNYVNPWGRDEAPWFGCMWLDQSLCVLPNPGYERSAFLTSSGKLFIKQDSTRLIEIYDAEGAGRIQLRDERIGLIDRNGVLWVGDRSYKDKPWGHDFVFNWVNVGADVADYQITKNRVAVLDSNGTLKIKEGSLKGDWEFQMQDVQAFSISDHRIGVLSKNGVFGILEGGLSGNWVMFHEDVKYFQLTDSRLAIVDSKGALSVKEGPLDFEWKVMDENVLAFQLAGTRVAIINADGQLLVNDGNLRAEWVLQADHVQSFQLADDRIAILDSSQTWKIKEGSLFQNWKEVDDLHVQNLVLSGDVPVVIE